MRRFTAATALVAGLAACSDVSVPVAPESSTTPTVANFSRGGTGPIAGQYIVRFRDDVQDVEGEARALTTQHGGTLQHVYRSAIKGMSLRLPDAAVALLRTDPRIAFIEQDQTMAISTTQSGATWGLDRIDQTSMPLNGLYTYNADGTGVTVYIVDTGINLTHTEYAGRASTGIDEVTPGGTAADCNGHGSHVSGTVGGTTYGVAKNVKLVAVRVLDCAGSGSNSGVIAGIDWVTANRVLPAAANMSLGGGYSLALNQAVDRAAAAGVTFAIAAGNSTADACNSSPASATTGITVGATDNTDAFASFSNYGTCVHINAPGVNITSAWMGSNTATNTISGTSMATPHVAGAAALYLQANPTATPAQVRSALTANASPNKITGVPAGTPNLLLYSGFITATPSTAPPVARFTSSCSGLTCSFDGSSTTALSGATYSWAFGDATTGSGVTTSHGYAAAGTYSVTLTVTDANGSSTATGTVSPTTPPPTPAPVATFTKSCSSRTCTFNASSSTNATSYSWAFGDGATGTGVTASHAFARNRSYTVTLTATGAGGTSKATTTVTCTSRCS
ncbi:MAG: Peptidase, (Subtilisin) subfamily [Gemmatimonadetes bacterium]|jgi:subtilisin family serine protease|nr:Peptidase, (Subtilisin) subfamily [Gemmatimonadota bacterium]